MTTRYIDLDENGNRVEIQGPDNWILTVEPLGYSAWLHSPDEKAGIMEYGPTKGDALRALRRRSESYQDFLRRTAFFEIKDKDY